jgi:hypothetical protein
MASPEWLTSVAPRLDALDLERTRLGRRGPKIRFSSRELESVFLFGWFLGQPEAKDARQALIDSPLARRVLALDQRCDPREARPAAELPSEPSLSRHRQRLGDDWRLHVYGDLARRTSARVAA